MCSYANRLRPSIKEKKVIFFLKYVILEIGLTCQMGLFCSSIEPNSRS